MSLHFGRRGPGHVARVAGRASAAIPVLQSTRRLMFIGDSRPAGRGAGTAGTNNVYMQGARAKSYPTKVRDYLAGQGFTSTAENLLGDAGNGIDNTAVDSVYNYDPRLAVINGKGTQASETPSHGGQEIRWNTTTALGETFTPSIPVDTLEIYYYANTGFGTAKLQVDGVDQTPQMVQTTPAATFVKATYTFTRGMHTFTFRSVSGAPRRAGYVAYDSTAGAQFLTINAGRREWAVADWDDTNGGNALNDSSPYNCTDRFIGSSDAIIVDIGTNDVRLGTAEGTFATQYDHLIAKYKSITNHVFCCQPSPAQAAVGTGISYSQLRADIATVASNRSCQLLDLQSFSGDWATMQAAGETVDSFHFTEPVHTRIGNGIGAAVKAYGIAQGWIA